MRQKLFIKRKGGEFMKRWSRVYIVLAIGFLLLSSTSAFAVHKGAGDLTCGNCHTIHNSQGGGTNTLGGTSGGALVLLRADVSGRQDVHKLCLQCHASSGTNAAVVYPPANITPPKVYIDGVAGKGIASGNTDPFDFSKIGAGGDFSATFTYSGGTLTLDTADGGSTPSLGHGHSLGVNATPPGGTVAIDFSCTSCHDPHGRNTTQGSTNGVNLYRMLRYSTGSSDSPIAKQTQAMSNPITGMSSWVGGVNGTNFAGINDQAANHIWPVYKDTPLTQNVYAAGSVKGVQSTGTAFSNFCVQCHVSWHESIETGNVSGNDWKRHPVDNEITETGSTTSGAGVTITDFTWYNTNAASALAPDTTTGATKVPAMQKTSAGATYYADDGADRVFCLSCHYAHGGPNYDALRWNYNYDVVAGNQKGNAIAANVGCQQCHNR